MSRRIARSPARAGAALCVLAALTALLPGCVPTPTDVAPVTPTPASPATVSAPAASGVPLTRLSVTLRPRWRGFSRPLYITNAGDGSGRLFVVEQGGTVRAIVGGKVVPAPYLDLRALVSTGGERGLLGIAFAPDFATSGRLYIDYTDLHGDTVIGALVATDPASTSPTWQENGKPEVVLKVSQPYPNHNGGCLQFGPDGMLYIGMGDGGSAGDPGNRAQDLGVLLGKMLRVDVSRAEGGKPYAIPRDNPFVHGAGATRPEIWSYGLRNPWRFSFDAAGGNLWIGDVGQDAWEEVDVAPIGVGGQDWGWRLYEGTHPYPPGSAAKRLDYVRPVYEYPHPTGESITGGYVYRGRAFPALAGTYVFADFVKGWIGALRLDTSSGRASARVAQSRTVLSYGGNPSSFGVDEAGELYLCDLGGTVYQVEASAR